MNILVGNVGDTFIVAAVEGSGASAKVDLHFTMNKTSARELYAELGRQLGAQDAWAAEERNLEALAEAERRIAALKGALTKAKKGSRK